MILDILTVLFLASGVLLILFMVNERRRDVMYLHHAGKSSSVQAKIENHNRGGPPAREMHTNSGAPDVAPLISTSDEGSPILSVDEQRHAVEKDPKI